MEVPAPTVQVITPTAHPERQPPKKPLSRRRSGVEPGGGRISHLPQAAPHNHTHSAQLTNGRRERVSRCSTPGRWVRPPARFLGREPALSTEGPNAARTGGRHRTVNTQLQNRTMNQVTDAHTMPQHSVLSQILLLSLTPQPCLAARGTGRTGDDMRAAYMTSTWGICKHVAVS
jgi:hypothetical protein